MILIRKLLQRYSTISGPENYVLSSDGKKCVDIRQDLCYDSFLGGIYLVSNILIQNITRIINKIAMLQFSHI